MPPSTALHFKPNELEGIGKVVLWGKLCCDRQNVATGLDDAEASAVAMPGEDESSAEQGCAICLSPFGALDEVRVLPCGHAFHRGCCDQWFLGRRCRPTAFTKACPVCRRAASGGERVPTPSTQHKACVRSDSTNRCVSAIVSAHASSSAGGHENDGKGIGVDICSGTGKSVAKVELKGKVGTSGSKIRAVSYTHLTLPTICSV